MTASKNDMRAAAAPATPTDALRRRLIELAGSARLGSVSDLAAGLTHELNQPLCAIVNYAEACLTMLSTEGPASPLLSSAIGQIRDQAERAGAVMRRLRDVI